ncbi:MAG: MFS transporter [Acidobacteria bacterium]|nr:MFS transporter [Acidobacteriota bacterium]
MSFHFSRNLWLYLGGGWLWSLGLMSFFLVYNVHLLDLGFQEAFIGQVGASMALGSLAATVPAGFLLNLFGLNRTIQAAVLLTALSLLARALVQSPSLLILFAFLSGGFIGTWIVAAPPFLAQHTVSEHRSRAFSLNYGGSIGMGIVAGVLVGKLPVPGVFGPAWHQASSARQFLLACSAGWVVAAFAMLLLLKNTQGSVSCRERPPAAQGRAGRPRSQGQKPPITRPPPHSLVEPESRHAPSCLPSPHCLRAAP